MKGLELLSLSENDQFASDEMKRFWLNLKNIQESTVTECEAFSGEMLRPTSENVVLSQSMLDLMIDYYIATYKIIDDTEETETCNVELWKTDFFPESRDCIIPVHNILCRFVPAKYKISSNRNATEYLAINPLNRKFHIR
ncbi:hypothetical protein RhiirC2_777177 [Rhizophagus irregularis]|uniref:Uncharacterized protein n=1 Tax=Rhizophagus irregularis TaxID=588596 RepID=A0A2N1NEY8_9GLOM|nr:hypothetical protein RhiirC2_777177 [Rhizophagus irregularis]